MTLVYYYQRKPDRVYGVLLPDEDDPSRTWTFDQLLAFLCELDTDWAIHGTGRWHGPNKKFKEGSFHFTFGRDKADRELSLKRRIEVDIPAKRTHFRVRISSEWVMSPPMGWVRKRKEIPQAGPGRPMDLYTGIFVVTKELCREAVVTLLRGDSLLRYDGSELSRAFVYVARFVTGPKYIGRLIATPFKKQYIELLSSVLSPPKYTPPHQTFETFKTAFDGYLKIWLSPRWSRDHLEPFQDHAVDYSILSGCWVHPAAADILRNRDVNCLDCLMLDTTWSVLRQYVTAFPVVIS
jgi:hypothetical protein